MRFGNKRNAFAIDFWIRNQFLHGGKIVIDQTFVNCMIFRGAFSRERVFELNTYHGEKYAGVTPVGYCHKRDFSGLTNEEPAPKTSIPGLVEATIISNGGNKARVSIPDGATIEINTQLLVRR